MAKSIDHRIADTRTGVKIELGTLYVYPDGHANLTFPKTADDHEINWPIADEYEAMSMLSSDLMRKMQKRANARGRAGSDG